MAAPYLSPAERAECFGPWAERDSGRRDDTVDALAYGISAFSPAVTTVSPETFASLIDMLDRPPVVSEELRRMVNDRRWR